jgi:hypothetical protein
LSRRTVVRYAVLGAAVICLAGWGAHNKQTDRALAAEQAIGFEGMQIANRASKANSLVMRAALITTEMQPTYIVASAQPDAGIERRANPVIAATPEIAFTAPEISTTEPTAAPAPKAVAVTPPAHEKAAEKPKRVAPPLAPAKTASNSILDDSQISGLKGRLRLTDDQVGYWPAVEAALREVVRTQLHGAKSAQGIDVNSPEVQKLIWAAMPLLMRLRDDQKSEVRKLARVIGLEQVASQI